MLDMLSTATIGGLFIQLAQLERKIRECDPLLVAAGSCAALSPQLLEWTAEEQQVRDELARRRAGLRTELESRLLAMQAPTSLTVRDARTPRQD